MQRDQGVLFFSNLFKNLVQTIGHRSFFEQQCTNKLEFLPIGLDTSEGYFKNSMSYVLNSSLKILLQTQTTVMFFFKRVLLSGGQMREKKIHRKNEQQLWLRGTEISRESFREQIFGNDQKVLGVITKYFKIGSKLLN